MDNFYLQEGREKVIKGIKKATSVIKGNYGAAGGNTIIEHPYYPFYATVNDGKTIVDAIKLADPIENIGASVIKEAGDLADKLSGDGRKTTMLLVEAIFDEASKLDAQPMEIKRSLNECLPTLLKAVEEQSRPITIDDVKSVATISAESEELGQIIQDAYKVIGKEGIIEVDTSNLPETYFEVVDGVRLRGAKCLGAYSWTETKKAVYKNPKILITKEKISTTAQLEPLFQALTNRGINELVIYCEDIDLSVASKLAITHLQGGFKTLLIKSPTLWKDWLYEDFALMTGAKPVDPTVGRTFKNLSLDDLGTCDKIVSTEDETRVIGIKDISEHLKNLEEMSLKDDQQKLRISWLNTKVAVLKVGANSETELHHKMKKAKDACHSSYLALKEGIVPGGGVALFHAGKSLNPTESIGNTILNKALEAPQRQIIGNSGVDKETITIVPRTVGFNVKTREEADMFEAGIVDATLVIKNALINSVSIASTVLTMNGAIFLPKQEENGRMGGTNPVIR